jgi:hypothetical protein
LNDGEQKRTPRLVYVCGIPVCMYVFHSVFGFSLTSCPLVLVQSAVLRVCLHVCRYAKTLPEQVVPPGGGVGPAVTTLIEYLRVDTRLPTSAGLFSHGLALLVLSALAERKALPPAEALACCELAAGALQHSEDMRVASAAARLLAATLSDPLPDVAQTPATLTGLRMLLSFQHPSADAVEGVDAAVGVSLTTQALRGGWLEGSNFGVPLFGLLDGAVKAVRSLVLIGGAQTIERILHARLWDPLCRLLDTGSATAAPVLSPQGLLTLLEIVHSVAGTSPEKWISLIVRGGVMQSTIRLLGAAHLKRLLDWPATGGGGVWRVACVGRCIRCVRERET